MDADIICLQEVQVDLWQDFCQILEEHQYTGVLQNVTGGHNVASALLVKKSSPLQLERLESRSRVLIGVLQDSKKRKQKVYLANVHLEAGEKEQDNMQRYHQLKSLFKRLSHHIQADNNRIDEAAVIMAGDFNMLRTNPLHSFLSQGRLQSPEQLKSLPAFSTIQLCDSFLEFQDDTVQPRSSKIHFASSEIKGRGQLQRTYAKGHVLDYIWHSPSLRVKDSLLLHPMSCSNFPQKWPSEDHPSDHLPVGVDFEWET
eukprot:scaffold1390_cov138-Cylindrotheca_fusiformis.AAC.1